MNFQLPAQAPLLPVTRAAQPAGKATISEAAKSDSLKFDTGLKHVPSQAEQNKLMLGKAVKTGGDYVKTTVAGGMVGSALLGVLFYGSEFGDAMMAGGGMLGAAGALSGAVVAARVAETPAQGAFAGMVSGALVAGSVSGLGSRTALGAAMGVVVGGLTGALGGAVAVAQKNVPASKTLEAK